MAAIPGIGAVGSLSSLLGGVTQATGAASASGAAGAAGFPATGAGATTGLPAATPTGVASPTGGTSFADVAAQAVDSLQATQNTADSQALLAATGQGNVADLMISSTEATLDTQMTVALRDKAVDAFNQIMGMQF